MNRVLLQAILFGILGDVNAGQCRAIQNKISGTKYKPGLYSNSFVIREVPYVGPRGCIRECFYQRGCDAVNYMTDNTCEILSTNHRDDKLTKNNSLFIRIADWKMV